MHHSILVRSYINQLCWQEKRYTLSCFASFKQLQNIRHQRKLFTSFTVREIQIISLYFVLIIIFLLLHCYRTTIVHDAVTNNTCTGDHFRHSSLVTKRLVGLFSDSPNFYKTLLFSKPSNCIETTIRKRS